jgi:hypothetical protein
VNDIEKTIKNWEQVLGIKIDEPRYIPPKDEVPCFTDGKLGDYSDVRLTNIILDNVQIELAEPGKNPGPWRDKLDRDGEGVQHISFIVPDRKKAMQALDEVGAPKPYHIGYWPGGTYSFTDAVKQLGVEINIKTDDDNTGKRARLLSDPEYHKEDL